MLAEIDPAARLVLQHRFPGVEILEDVASIAEIPSDTTVLTAGFPCQNLSMAGDKSGISGTKSSVVEKVFDLLALFPVPVVVIENVYFMLQLDRGNGMRRLADRFERLGYKWAYRVLDTMGFGLPQRRRRVYFVASRTTDPRAILFADERCPCTQPRPDLNKPLGFYWTEGRSGIGLTIDGIPPLKVGSALGIPSAPAVLFPSGEVLTPSVRACEQLQGFPADWTCPALEAMTKDPRWRLVGNAVSVPVARWVAQRIKTPGEVLSFPETEIGDGRRWPDAGWNVGNGRKGIAATDKPIAIEPPSVAKFKDSSWRQLSERALNGFLKRAVEGGLWLPEGFLDTLRHARQKTFYAA